MIPFLVVRNEFLRNLKNKKNLIIIFILPLMAIILSIGINFFMKPSINIGLLGNEGQMNTFIEIINDLERVNVSKANEDTINTDMILGKYTTVIELKGNERIVHCLNPEMKETISLLVDQFINNNNNKSLQNLILIMDKGGISIAERSCGIIFITLMISTMMLLITIVNDKDNGILIRYTITPNKISAYLIGKYLYSVILTFIQIVTTILIIGALNIDIGISLGSFFIVLLLIGLVTTSISMLIAILSKRELQGNLIASSFAILTAIIGGTFMSIEKMPYLIKLISNISISKWLTKLVASFDLGTLSTENSIILIILIGLSFISIVLSLNIGEKKIKKNK